MNFWLSSDSNINSVFIFFLLLAIFIGIVLIIRFFFKRKREQREKDLISSFEMFSEETALKEVKQIKSGRIKFFSLSGFKWFSSIFFSLLLLLIFFFNSFFTYYPPPEKGKVYPISLRAAYTFKNKGITYKKGEIFIKKGWIINERRLHLIEAYKNSKKFPTVFELMGGFIFFFILSLIFLMWLGEIFKSYERDENRNLFLIYTLIIIIVAFLRFTYITEITSPFYTPIAFLGMVLFLLLGKKSIVPVLFLSSLLCGIFSGLNFLLFFILLSSSLPISFWPHRIKKRSQLLIMGGTVGIIGTFLLFSIYLLFQKYINLTFLQKEFLPTLLNGIFSSFLTLLLIQFIEKIFGYVSPFSLMELSDLNSDLLRQLYLKAPGTYHHSLEVANLAEIAASGLDVDTLLLRVGAYYHDIGKMAGPHFFVENQKDNENPHDMISAYASAKIVKSHVSAGLNIGEKVGLPRKILDMIAQHHGTSLLTYFYEKAKKESPNIKKTYFQYPGPKPQSKEAAILMIVDAVEAASRVIEDKSEKNVREMVEKIIEGKMKEKQFDECDLTLSELSKIVDSLTKALSASNHKRIPYPGDSGIKNKNDEE